jgi:hypothetical protein
LPLLPLCHAAFACFRLAKRAIAAATLPRLPLRDIFAGCIRCCFRRIAAD